MDARDASSRAVWTGDRPRASGAAKFALLLAIGGVVATFAGHPFWGLLIELAALVSGGIGFLSAASPRVRGGFISIAALVIAVLGLGLAVLGMIGVILF